MLQYSLKYSQEAEAANIKHFGSKGAYIEAHGSMGTEFSGPRPRSFISFTTAPNVVLRFGRPLDRIIVNPMVNSSMLTKQIISGTESEVLLKHMVKIK